jgi:Flp pilus assembly protein TadD
VSPKSCLSAGAVNPNLGLSCNDFLASRQSVQAKEYMYRYPSKQGRVARLVIAAVSSAALAISLGGCQTTALSDITGSIGDKPEASASADPRRDVQSYRERYRANPKDPALALQYGKALRATGERAQAVAVLEQAAIANPGNKAVLAGYGRALADNGNFQQAYDVLSQAHSPEDPDWRILSAQGAVLDQMGRFEEARQYYASALKIVPEEPSVLSNLGLSYMLSKDLAKAEETLRRAQNGHETDARVRMNLALVLALEGRQAEAETVLKADLPPDEANARVADLKRLLSKKEASSERGGNRAPDIAKVHAN